MKLLQNKLPTELWDTLKGKVEIDANGVHVSFLNLDASLHTTNSIEFDSIKHDCTVYVFDAVCLGVHNLLADTYETKQKLSEYLARGNKSAVAILVVPVASDISTYTLIVRDPDDSVTLPTGMSYDGESGKDGYLALLPKLTVDGSPTISTDVFTPISIQLHNPDGSPFEAAGVTVYADCITGSVESVRGVTNNRGIAVFNARATADNKFRAKFGFRYYSGIAEVNQ